MLGLLLELRRNLCVFFPTGKCLAPPHKYIHICMSVKKSIYIYIYRHASCAIVGSLCGYRFRCALAEKCLAHTDIEGLAYVHPVSPTRHKSALTWLAAGRLMQGSCIWVDLSGLARHIQSHAYASTAPRLSPFGALPFCAHRTSKQRMNERTKRVKVKRRKWLFQVDSKFCGQCRGKILRRNWPFNLTHPFAGNAWVKFREGCCRSKLTHTFVVNARVEFREGSSHSKLTHSFVGNAAVKFREGCGHSKLTHPCAGHAGVKFERKWSFQVDSPFWGHYRDKIKKDVAIPSWITRVVSNAGLEFREGCWHSKLTHPFVGNADGRFRMI